LFRRIRVFVASPGDVQKERSELKRVVDELNLTISAIAPEKQLFIELVRWETHVAPSWGPPQAVINQQIGDDYDIFVGIMWKRMGTPTGMASSGTEEEFRLAKAKWDKNRQTPILLYFCQAPFSPPHSVDEVDQLRKVVEFRTSLSTSGLVADYANPETFADVVRPHLLLTVGKLATPSGAGVLDGSAAQQAAAAESPVALKQVEELASRYERLRREMEPGDARTRQFEIVTSSMRSLALAGRSLVGTLAASDSSGLRLAAISFLEALPDPTYLPWLAERVAIERPFVGYRAAMALLAAARNLPAENLSSVAEAINAAKASLAARNNTGTDRWTLLLEAESELAARRSDPNTSK
jgi:Domain of unknown function (DUF4062)